jgi:hypothetical protein
MLACRESLNHRQRERSRLPSARVRRAENISAGEGGGDPEPLNLGRLVVTDVDQRLDE